MINDHDPKRIYYNPNMLISYSNILFSSNGYF